jgi:GNAT superfamily N-acetyltransferase
MPPHLAIRTLDPDRHDLDAIRREAASEGLRLVERLVDNWNSGSNRFDAADERLVGAWLGADLVAIGGLTGDPYEPAPRRGRLRHLFVVRACRRRGVARALVAHLLAEVHGAFDEIRLRTHSDAAATFYEGLGFKRIASPHATHSLTWDERLGR